jgi:hypothetical protein
MLVKSKNTFNVTFENEENLNEFKCLLDMLCRKNKIKRPSAYLLKILRELSK